MAIIIADKVNLSFPIYDISNLSFKKVLLNKFSAGSLFPASSTGANVLALNDLNFKFSDGDRVGLIGPNGSGKTTLLRLMSHIYTPSSGSYYSNGKINSMLSITLGMDADLSGIENIYSRGYLMGVPPRIMKNYVDNIIDFSDLGDFIYLPMRTYSSGMAMRLAFSITTSIECDILLMDEWLSVGDASFSQKAAKRLDELVDKTSIVVVASHNMELIKNQCNSILSLENGRIINYQNQLII
jgi:lipopolysaccharide transport system ATP-binding protein